MTETGQNGLRAEVLISGFLTIAFLFLSINFDSNLGLFYAVISGLYFISVVTPSFEEVEIFVKQDYVSAIASSFVILAIWAGVSMYIWQILGGTQVVFGQFPGSFLAFFQQLSLSTNVPVLAADPTVNLFVYGGLIPFAESMLFLSVGLILVVRLLNFLSGSNFRITWSTKPGDMIAMVAVCVIIGILGSLFHLTARFANDIPLVIDFFFFSFSALVVYASTSGVPVLGGDEKRNMFKGVAFHVFNNFIVLLLAGGTAAVVAGV